jgi:hypothetical protein
MSEEDFVGAFKEREAAKDKSSQLVLSKAKTLEDFIAFPSNRACIYLPCREPWPMAGVDEVLPMQQDLDAAGKPLKHNGKPVMIRASKWLAKHRCAEQMSWWPGKPQFIFDQLADRGDWRAKPGAVILNLYKEPSLELGDPKAAGPWLEHVHRVYPDDAEHLICWFAHRVQRPGEKINHGLLLGGMQGIGKDTMLEPVCQAVGPGNVAEVSPRHVVGTYTDFVRSVILRVNEARDTGGQGERLDRFAFYDHLKKYAAAPPDMLYCNEKYIRGYYVTNCLGLILTSNYRTDSLYLPPDDRRYYVAWSDLERSSFDDAYWLKLWSWYERGGFGHVAAYLLELDLTNFNPKADPPKTPAFHRIVENSVTMEDDELADAIDALGSPRPNALTILQLIEKVSALDWLLEHKHRRSVPYHLERCGYIQHHNRKSGDKQGRWVIKGKRQPVYVKASLTLQEQELAAQKLVDDLS